MREKFIKIEIDKKGIVYARIDRKCVDLAEIAKIFQALFADLYPHGVENIPRRDQHFNKQFGNFLRSRCIEFAVEGNDAAESRTTTQ